MTIEDRFEKLKPESAYSKDDFVSAMKDFNRLEFLAQGFSSDNKYDWHPEFRKNLGDLLRGNQRFYAGMTPDNVKNDASEAHSDYQNKIAEYSKNKVYELLNQVKEEGLVSLVFSLPLVETGNEEYDKVKKAIDEKKKIEWAQERGEIMQYINERLKNMADWRKDAYFGYSMGDEGYVRRTFDSYAVETERKLSELVQKDGKIDKEKLLNLIKANYKKIVESEKDKEDSDKAKSYRIAIAKTAYESIE